MNIFQKTCPECAAANPSTAAACRCGYCFEADAHGGADPQEYAEEQNRLYRDYLAARIAQADAELAVAREQARADPQNTQKAAGALLAEQAVNALRAEMTQLSMQAATGTRAAPKRAAPAKTRATSAGNAVPVAATKTAPAQTVAARPQPAAQKPVANSKRVIAAPPVSMPVPDARRKPPAASKTVAGEQRRASAVKPDEKFTRLQAQRADAVARAKKIAAGKRPPPKAPTQRCPNCTATVAADAARCGCGYTFSRAEEVPALSLDAGALAILTGGTSSGSTRRR